MKWAMVVSQPLVVFVDTESLETPGSYNEAHEKARHRVDDFLSDAVLDEPDIAYFGDCAGIAIDYYRPPVRNNPGGIL